MKAIKFIAALLLLMSVSVSGIAAGNGAILQWSTEWDGYVDENIATFRDVPTSYWAHGNITRVYAAGWMQGYPDGTFRPNAPISRAEALTVLVKALSIPLTQPTVSSYHDVNVTDWYSPYIEAGKELFPEKSTYGVFQPAMPVTREDVIYALVKIKNFSVAFADQSVLNMFADSYSISESIKPYVAVAVSNGLVSGYSNGLIGAQDPLTRAEFATLLYRATYIGTKQ